ncbi:MAG TPA: sigma-54 dependent transcriptional regulator [Gemmatimonadaceae bacterium]|nr:sigma-54 dependent transcriptional regulator [Gemmatimonadaceae bacterium]
MPHRVLIVDDDRAFGLSTAALLRGEGYDVALARDAQEAITQLRASRFDLMLLDLRMPGLDGIALVEALRLWGEPIPVLMISGAGTIDSAVRALHVGADDFLTKPVEPEVLFARVAEVLDRRPDLTSEHVAHGLVGRSPAMRAVVASIARVAPTDATVLILGETGTGKELVARAVHRASPRADGPFVAVNCAGLAEGVLESELFGHVRGAFTGAVRDRVGVFEAAAGGSLLLDEVGDMSLALQQRLLRVLQEREIVRVGATRPMPVDVRVIASTHRDLQTLVQGGGFREDLLYRLNVFPITLPPLRDRPEDIALLVVHGLEQLRARVPHAARLSCSAFALRALRAYHWPGNVRELLAALELAAIHAGFARIEAQHLPAAVREAVATQLEARYRAPASPDAEQSAIVAALEHSGGVVSRAAELLGMGRTTLWRKLKAYGIATSTE